MSGGSEYSWSAREKEVAEILLKLPSLIMKSECDSGIVPLTWGCKRKRSAIAVSPKGQASSPATPFSFSPSESDDNNNNNTLFRRNVSLKRKREHYQKIIQDLTKDNNLLIGEIKNVKSYFDKLKDYNCKMKARKLELTHGPGQGNLVHKQPQLQMQFAGVAHQPPLNLNQTAGPAQMRENEGVVLVQQGSGHATTSYRVGTNDVGPTGIPDLNLPLDESAMEFSEPLDVNVNVNVSVANDKNLSRALAAQARQNRLNIYRVKNPIGTKPRYSCR